MFPLDHIMEEPKDCLPRQCQRSARATRRGRGRGREGRQIISETVPGLVPQESDSSTNSQEGLEQGSRGGLTPRRGRGARGPQCSSRGGVSWRSEVEENEAGFQTEYSDLHAWNVRANQLTQAMLTSMKTSDVPDPLFPGNEIQLSLDQPTTDYKAQYQLETETPQSGIRRAQGSVLASSALPSPEPEPDSKSLTMRMLGKDELYQMRLKSNTARADSKIFNNYDQQYTDSSANHKGNVPTSQPLRSEMNSAQNNYRLPPGHGPSNCNQHTTYQQSGFLPPWKQTSDEMNSVVNKHPQLARILVEPCGSQLLPRKSDPQNQVIPGADLLPPVTYVEDEPQRRYPFNMQKDSGRVKTKAEQKIVPLKLASMYQSPQYVVEAILGEEDLQSEKNQTSYVSTEGRNKLALISETNQNMSDLDDDDDDRLVIVEEIFPQQDEHEDNMDADIAGERELHRRTMAGIGSVIVKVEKTEPVSGDQAITGCESTDSESFRSELFGNVSTDEARSPSLIEIYPLSPIQCSQPSFQKSLSGSIIENSPLQENILTHFTDSNPGAVTQCQQGSSYNSERVSNEEKQVPTTVPKETPHGSLVEPAINESAAPLTQSELCTLGTASSKVTRVSPFPKPHFINARETVALLGLLGMQYPVDRSSSSPKRRRLERDEDNLSDSLDDLMLPGIGPNENMLAGGLGYQCWSQPNSQRPASELMRTVYPVRVDAVNSEPATQIESPDGVQRAHQEDEQGPENSQGQGCSNTWPTQQEASSSQTQSTSQNAKFGATAPGPSRTSKLYPKKNHTNTVHQAAAQKAEEPDSIDHYNNGHLPPNQIFVCVDGKIVAAARSHYHPSSRKRASGRAHPGPNKDRFTRPHTTMQTQTGISHNQNPRSSTIQYAPRGIFSQNASQQQHRPTRATASNVMQHVPKPSTQYHSTQYRIQNPNQVAATSTDQCPPQSLSQNGGLQYQQVRKPQITVTPIFTKNGSSQLHRAQLPAPITVESVPRSDVPKYHQAQSPAEIIPKNMPLSEPWISQQAQPPNKGHQLSVYPVTSSAYVSAQNNSQQVQAPTFQRSQTTALNRTHQVLSQNNSNRGQNQTDYQVQNPASISNLQRHSRVLQSQTIEYQHSQEQTSSMASLHQRSHYQSAEIVLPNVPSNQTQNTVQFQQNVSLEYQTSANSHPIVSRYPSNNSVLQSLTPEYCQVPTPAAPATNYSLPRGQNQNSTQTTATQYPQPQRYLSIAHFMLPKRSQQNIAQQHQPTQTSAPSLQYLPGPQNLAQQRPAPQIPAAYTAHQYIPQKNLEQNQAVEHRQYQTGAASSTAQHMPQNGKGFPQNFSNQRIENTRAPDGRSTVIQTGSQVCSDPSCCPERLSQTALPNHYYIQQNQARQIYKTHTIQNNQVQNVVATNFSTQNYNYNRDCRISQTPASNFIQYDTRQYGYSQTFAFQPPQNNRSQNMVPLNTMQPPHYQTQSLQASNSLQVAHNNRVQNVFHQNAYHYPNIQTKPKPASNIVQPQISRFQNPSLNTMQLQNYQVQNPLSANGMHPSNNRLQNPMFSNAMQPPNKQFQNFHSNAVQPPNTQFQHHASLNHMQPPNIRLQHRASLNSIQPPNYRAQNMANPNMTHFQNSRFPNPAPCNASQCQNMGIPNQNNGPRNQLINAFQTYVAQMRASSNQTTPIYSNQEITKKRRRVKKPRKKQPKLEQDLGYEVITVRGSSDGEDILPIPRTPAIQTTQFLNFGGSSDHEFKPAIFPNCQQNTQNSNQVMGQRDNEYAVFTRKSGPDRKATTSFTVAPNPNTAHHQRNEFGSSISSEQAFGNSIGGQMMAGTSGPSPARRMIPARRKIPATITRPEEESSPILSAAPGSPSTPGTEISELGHNYFSSHFLLMNGGGGAELGSSTSSARRYPAISSRLMEPRDSGASSSLPLFNSSASVQNQHWSIANVRVKVEAMETSSTGTSDEVLDLRKPNPPRSGGTGGGERLCTWCGKRNVCAPNNGLVGSSGTWTYCSERCYEQYRRDVFKRRAACLWCSNLNSQGQYLNSVSTHSNVDESKFCSDYCLNQFKLKLFVETVESETTNLQMKESQGNLGSLVTLPSSSGGKDKDLITPASWLSASNTASNASQGSSSSTASTSPTSASAISAQFLALEQSNRQLPSNGSNLTFDPHNRFTLATGISSRRILPASSTQRSSSRSQGGSGQKLGHGVRGSSNSPPQKRLKLSSGFQGSLKSGHAPHYFLGRGRAHSQSYPMANTNSETSAMIQDAVFSSGNTVTSTLTQPTVTKSPDHDQGSRKKLGSASTTHSNVENGKSSPSSATSPEKAKVIFVIPYPCPLVIPFPLPLPLYNSLVTKVGNESTSKKSSQKPTPLLDQLELD